MTEPTRLDYSLLLRDPALTLAIEMAREAKRFLEMDPSLAEGDPEAFVAILTLFAFGEANGNFKALARTVRKRALKKPAAAA